VQFNDTGTGAAEKGGDLDESGDEEATRGASNADRTKSSGSVAVQPKPDAAVEAAAVEPAAATTTTNPSSSEGRNNLRASAGAFVLLSVTMGTLFARKNFRFRTFMTKTKIIVTVYQVSYLYHILLE
jgi:hypothetical protein